MNVKNTSLSNVLHIHRYLQNYVLATYASFESEHAFCSSTVRLNRGTFSMHVSNDLALQIARRTAFINDSYWRNYIFVCNIFTQDAGASNELLQYNVYVNHHLNTCGENAISVIFVDKLV